MDDQPRGSVMTWPMAVVAGKVVQISLRVIFAMLESGRTRIASWVVKRTSNPDAGLGLPHRALA